MQAPRFVHEERAAKVPRRGGEARANGEEERDGDSVCGCAGEERAGSV